jgi:hypothetical protein
MPLDPSSYVSFLDLVQFTKYDKVMVVPRFFLVAIIYLY